MPPTSRRLSRVLAASVVGAVLVAAVLYFALALPSPGGVCMVPGRVGDAFVEGDHVSRVRVHCSCDPPRWRCSMPVEPPCDLGMPQSSP